MKTRRAVFLDRDGVIIAEVNYLRRIEQMRVLRGAPQAISRLRKAGYKVIVVSNQSGVSRGFVTRRGLEAIHRELKRRLALGGARLDALYYCPHQPSDGCICRKPRIGMIKKAVKRFGLDVKRSFFVGDSTTDMKTARNAGCRGVLVRTGKGGRDGRYTVKPARTSRSLAQAAAWILRQA